VIERDLGGLSDRAVLVIGGGETARLALADLTGRRLRALFVANRTPETAATLAQTHGGETVAMQDIPAILPYLDAVITATGSRRPILSSHDFRAVGRRDRPMCVVDLAVPRDVDPAVAGLPSVALHDLDTLLPSRAARQEEDVARMEGIVAAEVQAFAAWSLTRRVAPVIAGLRRHVEAVKDTELERIRPQLETMTERQRESVEALTGRLIDKMFHHLVVRLRLAAQTDPKLVEAAEFFFLHGEGGLFPDLAERESAGSLSEEAGSPVDALTPSEIER
jgi:glutamyl-tRNA reductase